jgi:hypothetical protein
MEIPSKELAIPRSTCARVGRTFLSDALDLGLGLADSIKATSKAPDKNVRPTQSFVSQRFHRIQFRSPHRRHQSAEHAHN